MFGMRRRPLMSQPPSLTSAPSMEGMLQAGGLRNTAQDMSMPGSRSILDPTEHSGQDAQIAGLLNLFQSALSPTAPAVQPQPEGEGLAKQIGPVGNLGPDDRPSSEPTDEQLFAPAAKLAPMQPENYPARPIGGFRGNQPRQMDTFGGLMDLFRSLRGYNQPFMGGFGGYNPPFMGGFGGFGGGYGDQFGGYGSPFGSFVGYGNPFMSNQGYVNPYFSGIGALPFQMGGFQPQYPSFGGFSGGFSQAFNQPQLPSMTGPADMMYRGPSLTGGRFA